MHVFITGHTGFKGSWLSMMFARQGHTVSGYSLPALPNSLFEIAGVESDISNHIIGDIRDTKQVNTALETCLPDVVLHLAAQPLVREGYRYPRETFEVNVMGTMNVIEASRAVESIKSIINITTDKVYKEDVDQLPYSESSALGGTDPYSASKSMADIMTTSIAKSFPGAKIVNARAGNVIGGGDVSYERLIPDLVASFQANRPATIRSPHAIRPWQHVLDCLAGYQLLLTGAGTNEVESGSSWNFGPDASSMKSVGEIAQYSANLWGGSAFWEIEDQTHGFHEATLLTLDSSKSKDNLKWNDKLPFPLSLEWTIDWYKKVSLGHDPRTITLEQIDRFFELTGKITT